MVQVERHRHLGPLGRAHANVPQVLKAGVVNGVLAGLDDDGGPKLLGGGDNGLEVLHVDVVDGGKGIAPLRGGTQGLDTGNQHIIRPLSW